MPNTSRAQIVATLGPATKDQETIDQLVQHQMDVVRLNFSWGTYEEHAGYIAAVRQAAQKAGRPIPIIQDLAGPRVQGTGEHHFDPKATEVMTEKDLKDLDFGLSHNIEYVCMSYIGTADDVQRVRSEIQRRTTSYKLSAISSPKVIAKIERKEALENLDAIIAASDAIMIGRGDLGQNIPIEQVPAAEQDIIKRCKAAGKPVITATQMLLSMVENPEPTRAEVTDVAYAIQLGSDAVMLSEETARGKYPIEAVTVMERIVLEAEKRGGLQINPL